MQEAMQNFVARISSSGGGKAETVRELLGRSKAADLRKAGAEVVTLSEEQTVGDALQVLGEKTIMSAPVLGKKEGDMEDVLGFCDVRDILMSFLADLDLQALQREKLINRVNALEEKGVAFAAMPLKDLKFLGEDGDFIHNNQAKQGSLLELVLKCFIEPRISNTGDSLEKRPSIVHRVACFDNKGKITHIISQSDIVRFLSLHISSLGHVASQTLSELGLVGKSVVTVTPETPAITALSRCTTKGLSGLPIVDAQGHLLGNFSITDLRSINPEHFGALALPVAELLALEHHTEFAGFNRSPEPESSAEGASLGQEFAAQRKQVCEVLGKSVGQVLLVVQPESRLEEVLDLLAKNPIHRVYIVDSERKPAGVVTCTDVLTLALRH